MTTAWGVTQVSAGRVDAVLIGKRAFQDQNFFSAWMYVRGERGSRSITDYTSHKALSFITHEIATLDSRRG
jgi:hypothetical protein